PKRVRLKRSNGRRLLPVPWTAAAIAIGVPGACSVTPEIAGTSTGTGRVLPFGLCQKPVVHARQARKPANKLLGITPAHVDHRHLSAAPMVCGLWTCTRGGASIPFFECHLELGNGEWLCDRHLVPGTFTGFPAHLVV